jgi:DNA-binding SARP family transcriptional activator
MKVETAVKRVDMLTPDDRAGDRTYAAGGWWVVTPMAGRVPRDVRSVLMLAGYAGLLAVGLVNVFESDLTGLVLIAAALAGAIFVQGRLLNVAIWLGILVLGLGLLASLDFRGVVPICLGLVGAVIAAWPDSSLLQRITPGDLVTEDEHDADADEPSQPATLKLRTIGRLELSAEGVDLSGGLLESRILAFIWLYLLARIAGGTDPRLTRSALGDEVYPRLDPSTQRQRLRGQIRDIQQLAGPLANRVRVDGELVGLDLANCDFDVQTLRALAARCRDSGILSRGLQRTASTLLSELGSGLFLPGWEELEHRVNGGRGGAADLVNSARRQVADDRADLAAALGSTLIAAGKPSDAIRPLEDAVVGAPHREDLVKLLISACLRTGQVARAKELQSECGLKEKA